MTKSIPIAFGYFPTNSCSQQFQITSSQSSSGAATTGTADMENMSKNLSQHFAEADKRSHDVWVHTCKALIGQLARPLLPQMGLSSDRIEPVALLDNAAGAGSLPQELHALLPRSTLKAGSILASDVSESMVTLMKHRAESEDWVNFDARVLDAQVGGRCLTDSPYSC